MGEPIVFISHHAIKVGKLDAFKEFFQGAMEVIASDKPRTSAQVAYLNADDTEVSFVHVFADADVMDLHFEGAGERSQAAYEFMDPRGFEIYGRPSDSALATMRQAAASGASLRVDPGYLGGFLRPSAG